MQASRYATHRGRNTSRNLATSIGLILAGLSAADHAVAQESKPGAAAALLEEVVVTARKREELAQDVPLSISAYDSSQIEALKVRDLQGLSVSMPNVALDDIGTFPR